MRKALRSGRDRKRHRRAPQYSSPSYRQKPTRHSTSPHCKDWGERYWQRRSGMWQVSIYPLSVGQIVHPRPASGSGRRTGRWSWWGHMCGPPGCSLWGNRLAATPRHELPVAKSWEPSVKAILRRHGITSVSLQTTTSRRPRARRDLLRGGGEWNHLYDRHHAAVLVRQDVAVHYVPPREVDELTAHL